MYEQKYYARNRLRFAFNVQNNKNGAKITISQARVIKRLRGKAAASVLAKKYPVSAHMIRLIWRNQAWRDA
jgi:sarcosine oxidase gamma subunit